MSANTEVLRTRRAVQLPPWVVVAVGLALAGALIVASIAERDTTGPTTDGITIAEEGPAGAQSDYAEMAALKAAVALELWAERHGIATAPSGASEGAEIASLKAGNARQFWAQRHGEPTEPISYVENTAPLVIDGELCGQCR